MTPYRDKIRVQEGVVGFEVAQPTHATPE